MPMKKFISNLFSTQKDASGKMLDEMDETRELEEVASRLDELVHEFAESGIGETVDGVDKVISEVDKSFSQSWLGYHSRLYYRDLQLPPPGAHFNPVRGKTLDFFGSSVNWVEYPPDAIREYILEQCGKPDIEAVVNYDREVRRRYEIFKADVLSILSDARLKTDDFIAENIKKVKSLEPLDSNGIIYALQRRIKATQDFEAVAQGIQAPAHILLKAEILPVKYSINSCSSLSQIARICASHILRNKRKMQRKVPGNRIFIGHGRSQLWRDLKDFLQDRLHLRWDEFNRISAAGMANTERLAQMLDDADFAFLILTAEDELADASVQARMNVIHEAGLFQGRLGFKKAIILLEEGCEEFSNIEGLGQIRFPQGDIKSKFEEIRAVLEREQII